jgi:hypothetical protein
VADRLFVLCLAQARERVNRTMSTEGTKLQELAEPAFEEIKLVDAARLELARLMPQPEELLERLKDLQRQWHQLDPLQIEETLESLLNSVLWRRGYRLRERDPDGPAFEDHLDVLAHRGGDGASLTSTLGFQFLRFPRDVEERDMAELAKSASQARCDRAYYLAGTAFKSAAAKYARNYHLVELEPLDLDEFRDWVTNSSSPRVETAAGVHASLVGSLSRQLAVRVARHPAILDQLTWFQLEDLLTPVFEAFGLKVTHTSYSQDGGKDHVVRFDLQGKTRTYYVELKHWFSRKAGSPLMEEFVKVVLRDKADWGILVCTSGHSGRIWEGVAAIHRKKLRLGDRDTILAWCQLYERILAGGSKKPPSPLKSFFGPTFTAPRLLADKPDPSYCLTDVFFLP